MKYFTVYKVTNIINNRYYIGKHITDDPYDSYMGSGKAIIRAIKKYGKENFTKEILYFCTDENEMNLVENYLVNPNDKKSYNMTIGGKGGWYYINSNNLTNLPEHLEKRSKKMKEYWTDVKKEEKSQKMKKYYEKNGTEKISEGLKSRYQDYDFKINFTETMTEVNRRLDKREDASAKLKQKWKEPEFAKKMENRKPRGSDGSKLKEKWNDPVWREYMLMARKTAKKRKKEK
jgi:dissimilatory sulfite reductase (desulfoviridin) alpha/beta subunit